MNNKCFVLRSIATDPLALDSFPSGDKPFNIPLTSTLVIKWFSYDCRQTNSNSTET